MNEAPFTKTGWEVTTEEGLTKLTIMAAPERLSIYLTDEQLDKLLDALEKRRNR